LNQLVSNALKFTTKGEIIIGCHPLKNMIRFFVRDSGIGIPVEFQQRIFEPFFQVENAISRRYEGTGLGLAIAKAYMEMMGGQIRLKSRLGEGSEFSFTLPCSSKGCQDDIIPNMPKEWGVKTILVAEDDDNNFRLIESFLKDTEVVLIRANNGSEAVEIIKTGRNIDLVLMDIRMPLMDGYEAAKQITMFDADIPILAQTAYADEKENDPGFSFIEVISKPFDKDQMLEVISKYL